MIACTRCGASGRSTDSVCGVCGGFLAGSDGAPAVGGPPRDTWGRAVGGRVLFYLGCMLFVTAVAVVTSVTLQNL